MRVVLVALVLCGLVGFGEAGVSGPDQASVGPVTNDGPVTYHSGDWPTLGPGEAASVSRRTLHAASKLVDFNKSDFAGAYVNANSRVVIVPATQRGRSLAVNRRLAISRKPTTKGNDELLVSRSTAAMSLQTSAELGLALLRTEPAVGSKLWSWSLDAEANSLRIGIFDELSGGDRSKIRAFAEANAIKIDVYVDLKAERINKDNRLEDSSPFAGGFRYTKATQTGPGGESRGYCSGGFGYKRDGIEYVLTAGHCFEKDTAYRYMWNTYDEPCDPRCRRKAYAGNRQFTSWDDGTGSLQVGADNDWHGDIALVNVTTAGKEAGNAIWWGGVSTNNKIPVTARRVPTQADQICINGATSGSDCGAAVSDTNGHYVYSDGDVLMFGDRANALYDHDCSQDGDSGGSVVFNHIGAETQATAIGIVSGHGSSGDGCRQYFTGIEEAIQAWGGHLQMQ